MRMFSAKQTIYIEITDTTLTLATMHHKEENYLFKNIYTQPLQILEVVRGIIFNPTTIYSRLNHSIKALELVATHCNAIIALPTIDQTDEQSTHCTALQATLCAIKTGLTVLQVVSISLYSPDTGQYYNRKALCKLPNLLQPFQPPPEPRRTMVFTGAFFLIAATAFYCFQKTQKLRATSNTMLIKNNQLKAQAASLQQSLKKPDQKKNMNQATEETMAIIENFLSKHRSYAAVLKTIVDQIPDTVILTKLKMGKYKQDIGNKPNATTKKSHLNKKLPHKRHIVPLVLQGLACDAPQIILFNKLLGHVKELKNVQLTQLQQLKSTKLSKKTTRPALRYSFTLQASLSAH